MVSINCVVCGCQCSWRTKLFAPVLGLCKSRPQCHFQTIQRNRALSTCRSHEHGTFGTVRLFCISLNWTSLCLNRERIYYGSVGQNLKWAGLKKVPEGCTTPNRSLQCKPALHSHELRDLISVTYFVCTGSVSPQKALTWADVTWNKQAVCLMCKSIDYIGYRAYEESFVLKLW